MTTKHSMIKNPIPWPNGARCAVAITFDVDVDSFLHLQRPADSYKRVSTLSTLQYDPQIGVPRILQTYRELGLKQTFFVPAWCIERYPDMVAAIVRDGHEVGHHGYIHEHVNELSEAEERFWLRKAIEIIERHTGKRPRGFRAPLYNFSPATTDLLIDEGFQYDASLMGDDMPYLLRGKKGHLVELPTHWAMDDWPPYVHMSDIDYVMPIRSPQEAIGVYKAEFDAMWEYGGLVVAVWHPFVTGRLARWHETVRFIEYMQARGGVWFASLEEIAAHVNKVYAKGLVKLREEPMPPYPGPVTYDKF